jgi:hypothetical protein
MDCLVDLLLIDLRFRNRREKIYRIVIFSLKSLKIFTTLEIIKNIYSKWLNH